VEGVAIWWLWELCHVVSSHPGVLTDTCSPGGSGQNWIRGCFVEMMSFSAVGFGGVYVTNCRIVVVVPTGEVVIVIVVGWAEDEDEGWCGCACMRGDEG
jgi:hypothetical protein